MCEQLKNFGGGYTALDQHVSQYARKPTCVLLIMMKEKVILYENKEEMFVLKIQETLKPVYRSGTSTPSAFTLQTMVTILIYCSIYAPFNTLFIKQ